MSRDRGQRGGASDALDSATSTDAGKRTRTEGLAVQRRAASGAGLPFMDVMLQGEDPLPVVTERPSGPVLGRRVPKNVDQLVGSDETLGEKANEDAHRAGMAVVIERAEKTLKARDEKNGTELFKAYMAEAMAGVPDGEIVGPGDLMVRKAAALTKVAPDLALGDASEHDVGQRRGTDDRANLRKLVANCNEIFAAIVSGHCDKDLGDVFGEDNVARVKRKYANAKRELRHVVADDEVRSDRSGFSGVAGLGGYANYKGPIVVAPYVIDKPDDFESVITMLHEAMHAGNREIDDNGNYITSGADFITEAEQSKLTNAAHYEVVPRRYKGADYAYWNTKFVPAGTTEGGVTQPSRTPAMQARKDCVDELRAAWSSAIDVYGFVREVKLNQRLWNRRLDQQRYSSVLRFWSRIMKLTIHEKTDISARSRDPARQPVSDIDMALAEGVCRRMSNAMGSVPKDEEKLAKFEEENSTAEEREAAHASVATHHAFLRKLVMQLPVVGPITGDLDGDIALATELGTRSWDRIMNPSADDRGDEGERPEHPEHHEDEGARVEN